MENWIEVIVGLKDAFEIVKNGEGRAIGIIGESGIGKTYVAETFLSSLNDSVFKVNLKGLPTAKNSLSAVYEAIYYSISKTEIKKKNIVLLLKKYTTLLPGFGKFLSAILEYSNQEAIASIITKSSLNIGLSPTPHIIKLIKDLAGKKKIILYCDDSQWLDNDSWNFIEDIGLRIGELGWLLLFIYNDRIDSWNKSNSEYLNILKQWKINADKLNWKFFTPKHWCIKTLKILCTKILAGECHLNSEQLNKILFFSNGIPLYVKLILDSLLRNGQIIKDMNVYVGKGDWKNLDIHQELRESIIYKLKLVYSSIPKSRESLEVASVIGEPFEDTAIDEILEICNSFQLLSEIEEKHLLIKYLFENRAWFFDHSQIREVIYKSIGEKLSQKLHHKVAFYFEKNSIGNPLTIAYHYDLAGDKKKAIKYKLIEAERLLNESLFESALSLIDEIQSQMTTIMTKFALEESEEVLILRGRSLFYLVKYKEAITNFSIVLQKTKSIKLKAISSRWLGRCYMKLDSQEDFEKSQRYLDSAVYFFNELNDEKSLGDAYLDLVVAYAHLNQFDKSEKSFARAEKYFIASNDSVGLAKLYRRSVLFMDSRLSAPILEKLADEFQKIGIPHERIMSLNNAATEYIYLCDTIHARKLLEIAIQESTDIGNFGQVYIYNNLSIIFMIEGNYEKAKECIKHARNGKFREVEQLIVDINETILLALTDGVENSIPRIERALRKAQETGEYAYIFPEKYNLAKAYIEIRKFGIALEILRSIEIDISKLGSYSSYEKKKWFKLTYDCLKHLGNKDAIKDIESKCNQSDDELDDVYSKFGWELMHLQFWSD